MNKIEDRREIPAEWTNGEIVYIYRNKGDASECGNYRPIFITKIIYKIGSGLIGRN